jgi:predicted KAP-like P-loop ATPase
MLNKLQIRVAAWAARRRARNQAAEARAKPMDTGIGAEAPIRTRSEDRLRRADFADRIATVLSELSPREGRVFAIRGGWGFGKSSLKNLVTERLDAKKVADWLDFNPWQWGDADTITRALFSQIAARLGGDHSPGALDRAEALRRYGAILTGSGTSIKEYAGKTSFLSTVVTNASLVAIATGIGFELPTVARVAAFLLGASVIVPILGQVILFFAPDRTNDSLDKIRKDLEERLRELDRPLVVFVDDIDRLEPDQIRMLLRQVKANANLPNIVFVLLFQPSIVERALDPVADNDGRAFLEKIVQANFDLPAVPVSMVHQLFAAELEELVGAYATTANGFSQRRWGNAYIGCVQPMLRNLRDARRLISSIAVHLPLHVASDVFEVNIVDFLLLETLRVFEPDLHQALFRERRLLLQRAPFRDGGRREADQAAAEQLLTLVKAERRDVARDALRDLFPSLEWAYDGMEYADDFHLMWIGEKRVCTTRYFPRYFELQTAPGEISESDFVAFLDAAATRDGFTAAIDEVEAGGLLTSLVARLDEGVERLPVQHAAVLLPGMFVIAQRLAGTEEANPFSSSWVSAWRSTNRFLKRVAPEERGALALDALRQTEALSVGSLIIHLSDPATRGQESGRAFEPALDLPTVEEMKTEWLRIMRDRALDTDALLAQPDLLMQLYRWRDYAGTFDEPRTWVREVTSTDAGFANLAMRLMKTITSHTWGDQVSVSQNTFDRDTIEDFIGIDVARDRCGAINPTEFPGHEVALRTLQGAFEEWDRHTAAQPATQRTGEGR